ncbi:MAG: hypothetical protein K0R71_1790 [Bacillales bacterium]|jgi:putative nucleotidyltransferase with HDIG domain|nr:hypothetical protein [Bacillales bacterium]
MYPTREEAIRILNESEKMNPGPWKKHSLFTAECAEKITKKIEGMDSEKAYILGLLHDIGRRFGVKHLGHVLDGYNYMNSLGYDEMARICLTHSFSTKDINTYIGKFDITIEEVEMLKTELSKLEYDDYDRLIQLCDCLASPNGVVNMIDRMNDVETRYNMYPENKRQMNLKLKEYFEVKTGQNIYEITSDDKVLWGK